MVIALTAVIPNSAWGAGAFVGAWSDNADRLKSLGNLTVTSDSLAIGRTVTYTIADEETFGTGVLYKVTHVSRRKDPFGCGPQMKVQYIAVRPLPAIEGTNWRSIDVFLWGGPSKPQPASIESQPGVCIDHTFGRAP